MTAMTKEIERAEQRAEKSPVQMLSQIIPVAIQGSRPRKFGPYIAYRMENAHWDARRFFKAVLNALEDEKSALQNGYPFEFKWTPEQAKVISGLIRHAINDPESPYPVHKGIYLWGDVFTGKTSLARALQHFHAVVSNHQKRQTGKYFKITDVRKMYTDFMNVDRIDLSMFMNDDRLFDDVGVPEEIQGIRTFAQQRDPIAEIMWQRYINWERTGQLTYMTSNLPFENVVSAGGQIIVPGWISRFDERLQTRLREMITPVLLPSNK